MLTKQAKGQAPERDLYPIPEARERLGGISQAHFYVLVKDGVIELTKLGRRSFVSREELRRVVARQGSR